MVEFVDYCVIGAGVVGSATALALSERGKVALLEQFPLPHSRGSSHGQSRTVRYTYGQEMYTALMPESFKLWKEMEALTGEKLLIPTELLTLDSHPYDALKTYGNILTKYNCKHSFLSPEEVQRQYPMLQFSNKHGGILEKESAIARADKCVKAIQSLVTKRGGKTYDMHKVQSIIPGQPVTIKTTSGIFKANKLIVTAGPWSRDLLLPLQIELPLNTVAVTVCYWKAHDERYGHEQNFPMFADVTTSGASHCTVYGFPCYEYPGLMKICNHHGQPSSPEIRDLVSSDGDIKILSDFIGKHFRGVETKPSIVEKCMYTLTPDDDFIIDTHPLHKNIVIGAGFSGHGFKMAPVLGKILAQLAAGEVPSYDITPFRISRFAQHSAKL